MRESIGQGTVVFLIGDFLVFFPSVVVADRVKKLGYDFLFSIYLCEISSLFISKILSFLSQLLGDQANQINFSP
jgi:hypothetical protein